MTTQQLSFKSLPQIAVADSDTTFSPGSSGVLAWSTTLTKPVYWNGSAWSTVGGAGSGVQLSGFNVVFTGGHESQMVTVNNPSISFSNPPKGFTVESVPDWDIIYTVTLESLRNGSFSALVTVKDVDGDSLLGIPIPSVKVNYIY